MICNATSGTAAALCVLAALLALILIIMSLRDYLRWSKQHWVRERAREKSWQEFLEKMGRTPKG